MPITKEEAALVKKVKYTPIKGPNKIKMPSEVPLMSIDLLIPYDNNVKIHTHQQIAKICTSIDRSGRWTSPIIVDGNNVIIAGHGRRLAAVAYGISKVPVLVMNGISEKDANILRIADNKVAEGEIDTNMLESELRILNDFGIDMLGIFDERELDFLIDDLGEIEFDAITNDISFDVVEQAEETQKVSEEVEKKTKSIGDVLGSKSLTAEHARVLSLFMALVENEQDADGIEALVKHASLYIDKSK